MQLVNKSYNVAEESRALSRESDSGACDGNVLTGESSGEDSVFRGESSTLEVIAGHFRYIIEYGGVRKMAPEHGLAVLVDLDRGDCLDARSAKGFLEAADAGEE